MLVYSMSPAGRCVSSYSIVKQPRGEVRKAKEERSLFAYFGPGGALIPLSSPPSKIEGDGAPQGAWPGLRQTGPRVRGSRAGPDRRALGVKRHAPRLAARQRGIFAFVPLTVVGPGRLLVAGEAARARPGDDGCVLRRPQVPLPLPANKTPPEGAPRRVDRDGRNIATLKVKSRRILLMEYFVMVNKIGSGAVARMERSEIRE